MSRIETGETQSNGPLELEQSIPTVLHDNRGKIVWKLSGNILEQNERIGISNVQGLFLAKFPEFLLLFPFDENGKIAEDKIKKAREFILERLGTAKKFIESIGSSPLRRAQASYFEGSHIVTLQKSLRPWGIVIGERDNKKRRWTIERIEQEATEFLQTESEISASLLKKRGKSGLLYAITTMYPGKLNLLRINLGLNLLHKPKGYWTPETIKEQATLFYQEHGHIDQKLLNGNGRSDLENAISDQYHGGIYQLQVDLGIKPKQRKHKPSRYWTEERIEQEALEIYQNEGYISLTLLRKIGRRDLIGAIEKKYPNEMTGLKERLGISSSDSEDTISAEDANEELMRFLD